MFTVLSHLSQLLPSQIPKDQSLVLSGFYPFSALLPSGTFDVGRNYQSTKRPSFGFTQLLDLTRQRSGIESVGLEDYLHLLDIAAKCSPGSSLLNTPSSLSSDSVVDISGSPFVAQLRCDSLPTCRFYSIFGSGPGDASLCNDMSWVLPYAKNDGMVGVKKSEIERGLTDYEVVLNYDAPCPDAFILMQQNISASSTELAGKSCSDNTACESFQAKPAIVNSNFIWDIQTCSVVPSGVLKRGMFYGVKKKPKE